MIQPVATNIENDKVQTDLDRIMARVLMTVMAAASLLVAAGTVGKAARPITDPDTPWHLVVGHRFLEGTSIRHPGAIGQLGFADWRPRDWLTQIVMAQFDDWFGLAGVAWLMGSAIILLGFVQYWNSRRWADPVSSMMGTALGLLIGFNAYATRPQMVSFVLVALTLGAVHKMAADLRPRWWLVPVTGLWACAHGLWFMSLALVACLVLGLLLDRRLTRGAAIRLGALWLACLLAVLITPNGLYLVTHPLGPFSTGGNYILEFDAPSRHSPSFMLFLMLLGAVLVTWLRQGQRRSWVDVGLLGLAVVLALLYLRTIVLGTILLTPFLAAAISSWRSGSRSWAIHARERLASLAVAGLALMSLAITVPLTSTAMSADAFPTQLDHRFDQLPSDAVVLNELGDGGYLMWRHPSLAIVGDGLSDQYSAAWLEGWFNALNAGPEWQAFVADVGVTHALLDETSPLIEELAELGWIVQDTRQARVLLVGPSRD